MIRNRATKSFFLSTALVAGALGAAEVPVAEYLPLVEGRGWRYEIDKVRTFTLGDQAIVHEIDGTSVERVVDRSRDVEYAAPVYVLRQEVDELNLSTGQTVTGTIESHLSSEPGQVLLHAQRVGGAAAGDDELDRLPAPVAVLKLPLPAEGAPYPSRLESRGMTIDARPYEQGVETVETSAGTFADCLRVTSRGPVSGALPGNPPTPILDGSVEETSWYAKGVGLVKQVQLLRIKTELEDGQQLQLIEKKDKLLLEVLKAPAGGG